jgi:hypothetical protein
MPEACVWGASENDNPSFETLILRISGDRPYLKPVGGLKPRTGEYWKDFEG